MSSEHLASAENHLKGNLGGAWDVIDGASGQYQDLGLARRFGGASAAYSLRDVGAMNGSVVRVRREPHDTTTSIDDEENFSANQVQSGALEDWVNGKLETTLPADVDNNPEDITQFTLSGIESDFNDTYTVVGSLNGKPKWRNSSEPDIEIQYRSDGKWEIDNDGDEFYVSDDIGLDYPWAVTSWTADEGSPSNTPTFSSFVGGDIGATAAYSLRKVKASYSGNAVRIRRIDNTEVDVAFDSDDKVSTSSSITNVASGDVDNTSETTLGNFLQGEANVRALFNSSAYFPSDSDYFSLGSGLTLSGAFTISYDVVFTDSFNTNKSRIFQDDAGNDLLTFTASDVCKFRVNGTVRTMPALSITLQLGRKYSMIFARDGSGNYTLTIDGVQVSSVSGSDTDDFLIQRIGFRNRGSISNININNGQHIYAGDGAENSNWTDTGSGTTTNATKVGTPVAFTGQGIDSFVETWYDQAGSNDATQATSANQPKIAEGGALITKRGQPSLKFRGTDSTAIYLDSPANITANFSFFIAAQPAADGTTSGSAGNEKRNHTLWSQGATFHMAGINSDFTNGFRHGNTILSYSAGLDFNTNLNLHSLINGSSNVGYFGNAVNEINSTNSTDTATSYDIGRKVNITSHNTRGYISEFIHYNSDQSDNRFKIESNINNYYGLYNDEYEWDNATNTEWQNNVTDGTTTFTADGKDGFTITATGENISSFKYAIKSPSTASNDYYKVSFNVNDPDGLFENAQLRLTATGAGATAQTITNGFNAMSLRTGASFEYMSINSDGGGSSKTATLSDFKISRIARNGFVETWYDQSGNFRPLIQRTATEQPSIVENGGFAGGVKANVASSNSTMQNLQVSTDGTTPNFGTDDWANGGTKLGLMYVGSIPNSATNTSTCVIWGGGRGVSSFQNGGLSLQIIKGGNDSWRLSNERQGLSPVAMTTSVTLNSDEDVICYGIADNRDFTIKVNNSTNSETESADLDVRENTAISLFGAYDANATSYYQRSTSGTCKECYLFSGDNITEVDTIATEINKHYNIY
jgi:hypothetical protein